MGLYHNLQATDMPHSIQAIIWQEVVVPMEDIIPNLWIAALTDMTNKDAIEQMLTQLVQMEEEHFVTGFH